MKIISTHRGVENDQTIPKLYCQCDNEIEEIEIHYGRTPYSIYCKNCKLSLHDIMPSGVGYHLGHLQAIEAFKDYCEAIIHFKRLGDRNPTQNKIREYQYRKLKGWGQNPHTYND